MSKLYDTCCRIIDLIDEMGMDPFRTRGAIALKVGYLITSVAPDTPGAPGKVDELVAAASEVMEVPPSRLAV